MKKLFLLKPEQLAYRLLILFPLLGMQPNLSSQTLNEDWWVPNGTVNTMLCDSASNTLYLGGSFNYIGPNVPYAAQLDPVTGAPDLSFAKPNGAVNTAIPDGNGGWYIGGGFTSVLGQTRNFMARINADGSLHPWNPDVSGGGVTTLELSNGILYAGGYFTSINGLPRRKLAAIDANTGSVTNWYPCVPTSTSNTLNDIEISGDNVYIGGDFTQLGYPESNMAEFTTSGSPILKGLNPNSWVYDIIPDGSGGWYIAGAFNQIGGVARNYIARINSDGSVHPWNPAANSYVNDMVLDGSTLYIAGAFTNIGGQTRNRIAALSTTTGNATAWNPNPNSSVYDMALSGSTLYVGGDFTNIGGQTRNRIAALSTSTGNATSWNPNANFYVTALALSGTTLYVGGDFTNIGGQTRNRIAALSTSTGNATSWNPNANSYVNALALSGTTLYVGGFFSSIGGQTRNNIAALSTSTGNATSWNPNANSYVNALALSGTTLYVGGAFGSIGGQTRICAAALSTSTGLATSWNPSIDNNYSDINTIAINGSTIILGGDFEYIGTVNRSRIASLSLTSGAVNSWNPTCNNIVNSLLINGTTLYVGGSFTSIGGQSRNRIAALSTSTGNATSWNPNSNGIVYSMALNGSTLYAAGDFTTIGGQTRNRIAALSTSTGLATSWNPNASGIVRSIYFSGNSVYTGGNFTSIGGQTRGNLAELDPATGLALAWDPNPKGDVYTVSHSGNKVFAGGNFNDIGGVTRNNLAAIDLNTGKPTSWNPALNGDVYSIIRWGSNLYIGGSFTSAGGQTRNRIAAVAINTGLATPWNPNSGGTISSMVIQDNTLYVGGYFTSIGGQSRNRIAALDLNTGLATSWNPGANNPVSTLAKSGTTLYIGGYFTEFGGLTRNRLAAVNLLDGTTTSWNPSANDYVKVIKPIGGTIFTGGNFSQIGSLPRYRIAAIDAVTGVATTWNPFYIDGAVNTIEVSGNSLLVGGAFTYVFSETRGRFAMLNLTTAAVLPWNGQFQFDNSVNNICISGDRIFVGGVFGFNYAYGIPYLRSYNISETLWQGNLSQDFNHPQNWSFGKADRFPTARIPAGVSNYPHINNDPAQPAIANSLTIDAGANLTIDAGKALTVNGTLTSSGTLSLESDATGTASIIHNTANVPATIGRYMDGGWDEWNSGWHQISSPVSGQAMSAFETSGSGNAYDLYGWDEPSALWKNYKTIDFASWNGGTTDFVPARGYLLSYEQTQTAKSFSGTVHTSDVVLNDLTQSAGSHSGWHLLGNPFASAVKWNDGNWALDNVAGIAKIWNEPASSYVDIAANELIASAQGFMVQVTGPDNGLTIPAASREHSPANLQKSVETTQKLVLQVSDAGGNTAQESCIAIHPEATTHYDTEYDARFLPGYAPLFYSVAGDEMLSTNTQPALESNTVIPLGFVKNAASDYSIILKERFDGLTIYLTDKKTSIVTNLTQTPVYNFSAAEGDEADRFLLHFGTVGMDDPHDVQAISVYTADGVTYLDGVKAGSEITFTGLTGQTVIRATAKEGLNAIRTGHLSAGVYLIRVMDSGVPSVHKVVIP